MLSVHEFVDSFIRWISSCIFRIVAGSERCRSDNSLWNRACLVWSSEVSLINFMLSNSVTFGYFFFSDNKFSFADFSCDFNDSIYNRMKMLVTCEHTVDSADVIWPCKLAISFDENAQKLHKY